MSTESPPKPSRLLIVVSVLGIGFSLYVLSVLLAEYLIRTDVTGVLMILFLGTPFFAFALVQFLGTFRRSYLAADKCSLAHCSGCFMVMSFFSCGVVISVGATGLGNPPTPLDSNLSGVLFLSAVFLLVVAGRVNLLWARKLSAASEPALPLFSKTYSLRGLVLSVAAFALIVCTVRNQLRSRLPSEADWPRFAEHVDAGATPFDLPAGATDVSYCRGYRREIAFEFTIDEADFRSWVKSGNGVFKPQQAFSLRDFGPKTPIGPSVVEIGRYNALSWELSGPEIVTINDGLSGSRWGKTFGFDIAYDRSTNRAYYHDWGERYNHFGD